MDRFAIVPLMMLPFTVADLLPKAVLPWLAVTSGPLARAAAVSTTLVAAALPYWMMLPFTAAVALPYLAPVPAWATASSVICDSSRDVLMMLPLMVTLALPPLPCGPAGMPVPPGPPLPPVAVAMTSRLAPRGE